MPFNFGQSSSSSRSASTGQSTSQGQSFVDPSQAPFLDFLRNTAQGFAGQQMGGFGQFQQQLGGLMGQGQGFLGGLQGAANQMGNFDPSAVAAQQTDALGQQLGSFYQNQLAPGIRRGAVDVGGLGGGREAVAQGVAQSGMADAFTSGAAQIAGNAQQMGLQANLQQQQALMGGLSGVGQMGQMAGMPLMAQFNPLMQLAGILGGPTVLSRQNAQSTNQSSSSSRGSGFNFGYSAPT